MERKTKTSRLSKLKVSKEVKNRFETIKGIWKCEDGDSSIRVGINLSDDGFLEISAFDSLDSELFNVSNLEVVGNEITFVIKVPSTGYRTFNSIRLIKETSKILLSYTVEEYFIKI